MAGCRPAVAVCRVRLSPSPVRLVSQNAEREGSHVVTNLSSIVDHAGAAARTGTALQALLAAMLGVVLLFGVGFAHIDSLHNAAHDTRHSTGFPCH